MINLLPYDTKRQTKAARMNVILVRYIVILGISAGFLILASLVTYFFINKSLLFAKPIILDTSSSKAQTEASAITTNLTKAKSILDQQVSYGKVISAIASALPAGTILNSLSINDSSFGATTGLQVLAKTDDSEAMLKNNFSSSQYFSGYKLVSAITNPDSTSKYPFLLNIDITINRVAAS